MRCVLRSLPLRLALGALLLLPAAGAAQAGSPAAERVQHLRPRLIGPAVTGGRIHDVEALPGDPSTIYAATASGGLWKSTNLGTTWAPLFDDQPVSTFGDLAISPSNPQVVWAGTGEQNNRQSTSWGNGVYRSVDGGSTWTHLGLEETRHIGRVLVHPEDPDVAYVAALGNLWAPSAERGVFRTGDGGRSWQKVLFVDTLTGVVDLVMDPRDPNTLYAAAYQRLRRAWGFNGGGPGSGIYKTTDGGRSWRQLTNGIPAGDKGRIGLAIARTNPRVLNATVEHAGESGTYRTEDGGESWTRVNPLNPRPMYYSHVYIDPSNENRVYVLGTQFYKSEDGGRTFREMPTSPTYDVGVHADFHAMWINPNDPKHFYLVGDGGFMVTWDMGETYRKIDNLPIGQFYAIGVDYRDHEPYRIYGGMQDNHSWVGPSATRSWEGIFNDDWRQMGFGDGMYQQPDPTDWRYVYTTQQNGNVTRLDAATGDLLNIRPYPPAGEEEYRWDWNTPILASRHTPGLVYIGGNRLFHSRDRGATWERSEDLTRRIDRDTLRLMGVPGSRIALSRNDGEQSFGEITTIAESPLDGAILWVGTDDGNVQVSRDGGRSWTEVSRNVRGVRSGTYVSRVLASASAPGAAYVAFDAHRDGDFAPYLFRTTDFGRSWTPLHRGLPTGSVNVVVEHERNPSLLFVGTEHALWVSGDAGASWAKVPGLPTTLYDDLVIHRRADDLVIGTHGRSIYVLDDLTPLVEWRPETASAPAHLFGVRPATVFQYWKDTSYRSQASYAGENPPHGAILHYHLARPAGSAQLTITDAAGRVVRTLTGPGGAGAIHRLVWDLRHDPPPTRPDPEDRAGGEVRLPHPVTPRGPFVSPGRYTATLEADGARATQTIEVRGDPMLPLTEAQHRERESFLLEVLDLQRRVAAMQASASPPRELQALARRINGLASEFNGGGVRQGSLQPPTATHRQRKQELEAELDRLAR
jgi:photosystem II stability/assembly factor-like uncharacterized protein